MAIAALGVPSTASAANRSETVKAKREAVCAELKHGARGLCNAYCAALNCPGNVKPACERLRRNFEKRTGTSVFPCDQPQATATDVSTPGATSTPDGATATPTPTFTAPGTPVSTSTPSATSTADATPGPTGTAPTPTSEPTGGPTSTVAPTQTATAASTAEATPTVEPTPTAEPTVGALCPTLLEFEGTAGNLGVLDTGWTGQAHDSQVVDEGKITVAIENCQNPSPPCGVCDLLGPVSNVAANAGDIENQRCTGNTATQCVSNADCSTAGGTCEFFFGTYLPLSAGGVSTCVGNQVVGTITGTANLDTGDAATSAQLLSAVFSGPTADNPCPKCEGDTVANDGLLEGTCNSGQNDNAMCDINGSSPNPFFGSTSLDCPPLTGGRIATLPIDLSNTTGTVTRTLTADSPNCRAPGFTALECFCDTCNDAQASPCASNADCPAGGICGGRRCIGGGNSGAACTAASECPGSACSVPGSATAPNQCDDSTCTSAGGNEGTCAAGPFEQFCGPTATFQGCSSDADCAQFAGNTCSIGEFRECFTDNGVVNASVSATGIADPPVNGVSDPTIAALFCIGPTSASAVNTVAGLPGLGRIELIGHAVQLP